METPVENSEKSQRIAMQLRRAAMELLARREHSRTELARKLRLRSAIQREKQTTDIDILIAEVLDQLESDHLLNDMRFAESYVRYRRARGFGPLLIRQELRNRISNDLISSVMDLQSDEWLLILVGLIARKRPACGSSSETVDRRKSQQKLYRFCQSRGFTSEQIEKALLRSTTLDSDFQAD